MSWNSPLSFLKWYPVLSFISHSHILSFLLSTRNFPEALDHVQVFLISSGKKRKREKERKPQTFILHVHLSSQWPSLASPPNTILPSSTSPFLVSSQLALWKIFCICSDYTQQLPNMYFHHRSLSWVSVAYSSSPCGCSQAECTWMESSSLPHLMPTPPPVFPNTVNGFTILSHSFMPETESSLIPFSLSTIAK